MYIYTYNNTVKGILVVHAANIQAANKKLKEDYSAELKESILIQTTDPNAEVKPIPSETVNVIKNAMTL